MNKTFGKFGNRYVNMKAVKLAVFTENGFLGSVKDGEPTKGPVMTLWFEGDQDPIELTSEHALLAKNILEDYSFPQS